MDTITHWSLVAGAVPGPGGFGGLNGNVVRGEMPGSAWSGKMAVHIMDIPVCTPVRVTVGAMFCTPEEVRL